MDDSEPATTSDHDVLVLGMGGTIDKDYPRSTMGYAFEIDDPAAERILAEMRHLNFSWRVESICRKDSTEIEDEDRARLVAAIRRAPESRVVVTHGTDTLIETARHVLQSGAAASKVLAFTGAMKPERFKDSDASFNVGAAVGVTDVLPAGSVVVVMGGRAIHCSRCERDLQTGLFVDSGAATARPDGAQGGKGSEGGEGGEGSKGSEGGKGGRGGKGGKSAVVQAAQGGEGKGGSFLEAVLTRLRPAAMQYALGVWCRTASAIRAEQARAAHVQSALQGKWALQRAFQLETASAGRLIRGVLRWWQDGALGRAWASWLWAAKMIERQHAAQRMAAQHGAHAGGETSPHVRVRLA